MSRGTVTHDTVIPGMNRVVTSPGDVHRVNLQMVILAIMLVGEQQSPDSWRFNHSLEELSLACGLSRGTVRRALRVLERNGLLCLLSAQPHAARRWELTLPGEH